MCVKPYRQGVAEYGCGQCMPCRISRRRIWTTRILMEMQNYAEDECLFVTLTYDEQSLPRDGSLEPRELQLYLKRLRERYAPSRLRYYAVGEYGEHSRRPHYHLILFGVRDDVRVREAWQKGFVHVGSLTEQSAGYVTGYVTNKLSDKRLLRGLVPEFSRMSLKPGIGARAMRVLGKVMNDKHGARFIAATGDVSTVVRSGKSSWPLGRYLRQRLREEAGVSDSAGSAVAEARNSDLAVQLRKPGSREQREEQRLQVRRNADSKLSIQRSKGRI